MTKKLKIHIKKGDQVRVISGKYKGHIGYITKVHNKTGKIIIKNINFKTKHCRPLQEGQAGQIIQQECPIDSSNVALYRL